MLSIHLKNLHKNLQKKAFALEEILHGYPSPFVIACSGGLDSRFLAYFAKLCNCNFSLIHMDGIHIDPTETSYLQKWSKEHQLSLTILPLELFHLEQIAHNHKDRCYHCKLHSFKSMKEHIQKNNPFAVLCDGSHLDDSLSYRPGLRALQELDIQSPLALAKINKEEIRTLAKALQLDNYQQKARPCLLTRFPYNTLIEKDIIHKIKKIENILQQRLEKIFPENIPDFRVRYIDKCFYFHYDKTIEKEYLSSLQKILKQSSIQNMIFVRLDKISGYFDTE